VRGFLEAEALGDTGVSGTAELRSPHLIPSAFRSQLQELRAFAFVDGAKVFIRDAILGQEAHVSLMSYGAGGNFQMFTFLNGSFAWAKTVYEGPATPAGKNKFLFRVWAAF
jgi:hemolysin activation/secretion protein